MQIQSDGMCYSIIILRKFSKRAQIPFGAIAKGNLFSFRMYGQKQKDYFFNDYQKFFLLVLANFELQ
jgi:hypothetical protein